MRSAAIRSETRPAHKLAVVVGKAKGRTSKGSGTVPWADQARIRGDQGSVGSGRGDPAGGEVSGRRGGELGYLCSASHLPLTLLLAVASRGPSFSLSFLPFLFHEVASRLIPPRTWWLPPAMVARRFRACVRARRRRVGEGRGDGGGQKWKLRAARFSCGLKESRNSVLVLKIRNALFPDGKKAIK